MENKKQVISEDEIDLKELFLILWARKFFIVIFTFIVTTMSIIYSYMKTPVFEVKANIKIGSINKNLIENIDSVKNKLDIIYNKDTLSKDEDTYVSSIKKIKGSKELLEIKVESTSNEKAVKKIEEVMVLLKKEHTKEIQDYKKLVINKIKLLDNQLKDYTFEKLKIEKEIKGKETLSQKFLKSNPAMAAIYIININELNKGFGELKNKIFDLNKEIYNNKIGLLEEKFENTEIFSKMIINEKPIKPKKKLIAIVAFITSFILGIFIVFLMNFIKSIRNENNENNF